MDKIITRCFQRGAFYNACRFLAKSALTAFVLVAAAFTANAAEVISINFARYANEDWNSQNPNLIGDIKGDGVYPGILEDQITADAWNNILRDQDGGKNSSKFLTTYWNGTAAANLPADTVKVAWNANSIWSDDVNANDVVKAYLDDSNQDPTATVTGIPYDTYDVIIYCHGEGSRSKFHPYTVNGWSYTYADGATVFNGTADWGNRQQQPEEGKNALRINGLGAPRGFYTPMLRTINFPTTKYGEDYAVGLRVSREYQIGRIYDPVYNCRRWDDNSDANCDLVAMNNNNFYKDRIRTWELKARIAMNKAKGE